MEPAREPIRTRTLWMLLAVVPVAVIGTVLAAAFGRLDSALMFVGLPCLLALVIGLLPSRESAGQIFQGVTVSLLLVSALLHEGALCVLIVSPLVYGFAFAVYGLVRVAHRRSQRLGAGGVLVVLALEGVVPALSVNPHQHVDADRIVAADCATFEAALARGPRIDPDADRGPLLHLAQYPTPVAAHGDGLAVGDTWELTMPAGSITTEVVGRGPGRLDFDVLADGARTTRWVTLTDASLTWRQDDEGCRAEVGLDFERDLDPAFYFGPVTELFMTAGADAFLAGLD